uniref:Glycolipid transfer protein n=1 Tax=Leptobrachium leishanense TaxID=445787 RepID=A0A8C5P6J4_9ANUR
MGRKNRIPAPDQIFHVVLIHRLLGCVSLVTIQGECTRHGRITSQICAPDRHRTPRPLALPSRFGKCQDYPDCLGPAIFSPIKSDITGNITKIRAVYESNPTKFKTLQQILEGEKEMYGPQWPKVGATLALMWLKRALKFIQVLLQSMADGERDEQNPNLMKVNVTKAYEIALKKYHGWLVQKLFQAALIAAPYKSDFLKALSKGHNVKEEECVEKIRQFLVNYTPTIECIYIMYNKMNAELDYKA